LSVKEKKNMFCFKINISWIFVSR